jgi:hypothetical protein
MRSSELTIGRTIAIVFDHGDDFYVSLAEACRTNGIRQGYIPMFIAGPGTAEPGPQSHRAHQPLPQRHGAVPHGDDHR